MSDTNTLYFGDFFTTEEGVFYTHRRGGDREDEIIQICSPLIATATTRNSDNKDWGKLLSLFDPEGNEKRYHIKNADLVARPQAIVSDLLREGLTLLSHPRAKSLLIQFLSSVKSAATQLSSAKTGWVNESFVLQTTSFGSAPVVYSGEYADHGVSASGDWRSKVGRYCAGNSRLILAASTAFAAPLLTPLEMEGAGFHLRGESSVGKSTALEVAASVYGSPTAYVLNWNTTNNALEQVAEAHNDCLMILDELGQVDPKILGETLYMLANGQGKGRMGQVKRKWKVLFLTSGEISLAEHMGQAGKEPKKGQEVRLLDIAADAGSGMGLLERLHGFDTPGELATYLKAATRKNYGSPIEVFLTRATESTASLTTECRVHMTAFADLVTPKRVSGEVPRAILRFGIVAAAGEIATKYGITGWEQGDAIAAAEKCFLAWMEHRRSFDPTAKAVDKVRTFIATNDHRFELVGGAPVVERVGYKKNYSYLILPEVFNGAVCAESKPEDIAQGLERAGYLATSGKNRLKKQERIDGQLLYFYSVSESILEAA